MTDEQQHQQHELPSSAEEGMLRPTAAAGVVDERLHHLPNREAGQSIHNLSYKKPQRRELRNNLTAAEASLWNMLKNGQLASRKFRRQHGVGPYVVDFYCPAEKLIVELDGAGHFTVVGEAHDVERTRYLAQLGFRVVRFENKQLWNNPAGVRQAIMQCFNDSSGDLP